MTSIKDKIGYGLGDMASSMFWKIFSYYLPFFYANIYGLRLVDAAMLFLVTRLWDAVSDPMMGIVADRTESHWGKYRPYLLWFAIPFAVCGIMLMTTPHFSYQGKCAYAYITYIMMMTVYTGINVPYGALLGVITPSSEEKTVFSSYRMFFAYMGSFIVLAVWEPLCSFFSRMCGDSPQAGWQCSMIVIAVCAAALFIGCFRQTSEKVYTGNETSVGNDLKRLMRNAPWWLLIGAALSGNLFCTVRGSAAAFYFADVVGAGACVNFFGVEFGFFAGFFLSVGEIANMAGVALTVPVSARFGKKSTLIAVNILLASMSIAFFYLSPTQSGFILMLVLQIVISICTGIISPLIWSMYADVSDYSELRWRTASTGLIFSSASMAQKLGNALGGSGTLWMLGLFGYATVNDGMEVAQTSVAMLGLRLLMSYIPACGALLGIATVCLYPLTSCRMREIDTRLQKMRSDMITD